MRQIQLLLLTFMLFFAYACSSDANAENSTTEGEPKNMTVELEEYGLEGVIQIANPTIQVKEIESNYEQQLLKDKKIEIQTEENVMLVLAESQENAVEMKVEFAEGFGEVVVDKGDNFCIIEQEGDDGEKIYDVSVFHEKDGAFIEIKAYDPETEEACSSLDQAKKGMELAKTFKFK